MNQTKSKKNETKKGMIFVACRTISAEMWKSLPSTTSAIESLHAEYYQTFTRNLSLVDGATCLLRLAELLETRHEARLEGLKTRLAQFIISITTTLHHTKVVIFVLATAK